MGNVAALCRLVRHFEIVAYWKEPLFSVSNSSLTTSSRKYARNFFFRVVRTIVIADSIKLFIKDFFYSLQRKTGIIPNKI